MMSIEGHTTLVFLVNGEQHRIDLSPGEPAGGGAPGLLASFRGPR